MKTYDIETVEDFLIVCFSVFQCGQQIPTKDGFGRTYEFGDWIASERSREYNSYPHYHLTNGKEEFTVDFNWVAAPPKYDTNRKLRNLAAKIIDQFRGLP